ncbi:MAG TPA: hypothetical protein VEQ34_09325, partial [Pyrinomonadaceae bacterium]|nr:hypothetical protein [Pyrinomonadaceae bacterium]
NVRREDADYKKTEVQSNQIRRDETTNGSVYANRSDGNLQANVVRFKLNVQVAAQTGAQSLSQTQARQRADEIIANNGGKDNLDTEGVGRDLANLARQNPADAWAVTQEILGAEIDQDGRGKVEENDKDEIAQSFAGNLSDAELNAVGQNASGRAMLERFGTHLQSGSVHDDERATALRLETAAKGYPPPELTGNPERDIQTVAEGLRNLPVDKRDDYLNDVLAYPYGREVLQRAGVLNNEDRDVLASAINEAYRQNPTATRDHLNAVTDLEKNYPYYEWTGLADVVRRTGNDDLIAGYAKHAMQTAAGGGAERSAWSVDALTALGGMSPEGLRNFINFGSARPPQYGSPSAIGRFIEQNRAAFNTMLTESAGFLGGPANNAGFPNEWAFNPAMGDLLNVASRMTDANGRLTSEALDIFKTVAPLTGDNFFTKEAAGRFFIEHAQQITDTFALKRNADGTTNRNFDPNVLKDFFINVVYSPISDLLQYNGGSMVEAIMGNGQGNGGVIGQVAQNIMNRAAQPGADVTYLGQEIGYLYGAISGGFLDSVEAYKDKFEDDKKFREFLYGAVNKGLGALGGKIGLPLEKVGEFVQKLIEDGAEDYHNEQLRQFQEAFLDLKNEMSQSLLDFQQRNPRAEGLETNFTIAWTDFITSYLATDWIAN